MSGVLFVCMGNICRSPTAEAVFRDAVARAGLNGRIWVDSAGTHDYHIGEPPDPRAIAAAGRRGYDLTRLRARLVNALDFSEFQWILAMDRRNLRAIEAIKPTDFSGHLGLFLDFAPVLGVREVPDPFFGGIDGFESVLDLVERGAPALLSVVR